jgi:hypothetical protein
MIYDSAAAQKGLSDHCRSIYPIGIRLAPAAAPVPGDREQLPAPGSLACRLPLGLPTRVAGSGADSGSLGWLPPVGPVRVPTPPIDVWRRFEVFVLFMRRVSAQRGP